MEQLPENFNPLKPTCPRCKAVLSKKQLLDSTHRDEPIAATLNIYRCGCGAMMGVVVPDDLNPNDPYIVKTI